MSKSRNLSSFYCNSGKTDFIYSPNNLVFDRKQACLPFGEFINKHRFPQPVGRETFEEIWILQAFKLSYNYNICY